MQRIHTAMLCTAVCLLLVMSPAAADVLEDILDRRVIRIGVAEFVPWTMRSKSGELIGFEIDVARKLAADMGVRADIRVYELNDIIPAVQQGEIDVIAGGLAITPRRALQVSFSRPLASTGISVAVNGEKLRNVSSLEHLDDERVVIAAVSDTLALNVSQTFFPDAEIRVFETAAEAETELLENRAHAYLASEPEVDFLAMQSGGRIEVPIAEPMMATAEGLAVRRGEQELLNFLDAWVVARQTDKWLVAARNYWFKSIDWAAELAE